jgi:sulfatase maturation enzyme AslB (radical SAM superfamily)
MHEKKARLILSVNRVRISLDGTDEVHDVEKDV